MTGREFAAFVEKLGLEEHDPGVRSLALIVPLSRKDLPAWLAGRRAAGEEVGKVMPSGDGPVLYVVQYSEPARRGARAVGWDLGGDPLYRGALERARDTGQAALAGPLAVPHATKGPIFALAYPLYATATVPKTPDAKQDGFRGALSLLLNVPSLMEEALAGSDPDIEVTLYDGRLADPARLLFAPAREAGAPAPSPRARRATDSLSIGGKVLTLVFTTLPGFSGTQGALQPALVLGGGLATSLLLSGLLWAVTSVRERALGLAEQRTLSLRESERRYREVFLRMADGLLVADRKTLAIVDANPALEKMLGYTRAELLGRTVLDISGHDRGSVVRNAPRVAELGSFHAGERLYVRKDGTTVRLDSSLLEVKDRTQDLVYAFLRDLAGRNPPPLS